MGVEFRQALMFDDAGRFSLARQQVAGAQMESRIRRAG
jgi:hypothetical protein